jgi:hypothetical protein
MQNYKIFGCFQTGHCVDEPLTPQANPGILREIFDHQTHLLYLFRTLLQLIGRCHETVNPAAQPPE